MVGIVLAVLGVSACTVGKEAPAPAPRSLREGLLTQDRLPPGFTLDTADVNSTTTGARHTPSPVPIASMPCSELSVNSFMTTHAPPLEDVAVGVTRRTPDGDEDMGWFGQEALDRYAPGRAAEVMEAIRGAAKRCASFTDTLESGTTTQETASVTAADVPADESLLLHLTSTFPKDPKPFEKVTGFVRKGDVILMVQHASDQKPPTDTRQVLAAAVKAYRAAGS